MVRTVQHIRYMPHFLYRKEVYCILSPVLFEHGKADDIFCLSSCKVDFEILPILLA